MGELTSTGEKLYLGLVTNVTNTGHIRQQVIGGKLNCVLIRPCLVPSLLVVATAANKACLAKSRSAMRTRSVNTEILFNMSSSSNISDSLIKFGTGDTDKEILVVGVETDLLESFLDTPLLTKLHKLKPDELNNLSGSL